MSELIELEANAAIKLLRRAISVLGEAGPVLMTKPSRDGFTEKKARRALLLVDDAIGKIEVVLLHNRERSVEIGRKGGKKTAERGPDYFRQIAAMRKTKGGGRPKKQPDQNS